MAKLDSNITNTKAYIIVILNNRHYFFIKNNITVSNKFSTINKYQLSFITNNSTKIFKQ